MHPLGATLLPGCFEHHVNETVAVSWHNINYPIKIEWVINCPSLPVLITLAEKGHFRGAKRGEEERRDEAAPNKDLVRHMPRRVCVCVCVCVCVLRGRKRWRVGGGGGHVGGRLMWFSLGAPRGLVLREKQAY